jgi:hypothetical protein
MADRDELAKIYAAHFGEDVSVLSDLDWELFDRILAAGWVKQPLSREDRTGMAALYGYELGLAERDRVTADDATIERMARAMARTHFEVMNDGSRDWNEREDWKVPRMLFESMARAALRALHPDQEA